MNSRALTIALVASLALNLFVIGAVAGGVFIGQRLRDAAPAATGGRPRQPLWTAADSLPPEHRGAYRQILRGQAMEVGGQLREARQARRAAWAGLAADPLDGPAVAKRLAEARALEMTARSVVEERIVTFATTLTPAERAALAEGLTQSERGAGQGVMRQPGRD